ncbi:hypothetical protein [Gaoshiqia sediminis]|uniref:Uncharacterized protein n=1 Tax=Gaoshiqia sediminis TaxID=2986998 RepID=A0AA42C758_9BACT|nr:hypothetical protein [Gaoshiqia sediminis]MCW0484653.1 hypothetical protein [Gaoshiqia sediminis]
MSNLNINPYLVLPKSELIGTGTTAKLVKGAALLIKGKIGVVKHPTGGVAHPFTNIIITLKIKIGNKYYNGFDWTTTESFCYFKISDSGETAFPVFDYDLDTEFMKMINLGHKGEDGIFIPITQNLSGKLEVEIYSDVQLDVTSNDNTVRVTLYDNAIFNTMFIEYWLNNLSVEILQADGENISDEDIEYIGILDSNYKDEGEAISLTCGTQSKVTDRAKLLYLDADTFKPISK